MAPADKEHLEKEIARGLLCGFYRELTLEEAAKSHCIVGAFFLTSAGKQRMVIDYRLPNSYLADRRFTFLPGAATTAGRRVAFLGHLGRLLPPRDPPGRPQVPVLHGVGGVFEPVVMPFGLQLAPYYWTKVCRPVVAKLRRLGFQIVAYVDEFGGAPPSAPGQPATRDDAIAGGDVVRTLLADLGLSLHPRNRVWDGPVKLPLLGHVVDTARGLFILKPDRAEKIMRAAGNLLGRASHHRRRVKPRALGSFCGLAVSSSLSVISARYHLRALYSSLGGSRSGNVRLDHHGMRDLQWWAALTTHPGLGRSLRPPAVARVMHTDASLSGWGAVFDKTLPARGLHAPTHRGAHINLLELVTVRLGLQSFRRFLSRRDTWMLLKSNSTVTVGVVNSMASTSPVIMAVLRNLHSLCHAWGLHIRAEHLLSAVNAYADRLSREGDSTDWSLPVDTVLELEARFGPHTVD